MLACRHSCSEWRHCAQTNAPAAAYWLRRVLDDGGRRDRTSPSYKGCHGRSLQCTVTLFAHIAYGRCSVLLRWRCDTLWTSGFMAMEIQGTRKKAYTQSESLGSSTDLTARCVLKLSLVAPECYTPVRSVVGSSPFLRPWARRWINHWSLWPVTHGQCDARPTVTFPAAGHHRPLTGTKLYFLVTEAHACEQLAQGCYLKVIAR